MNEKEKKQQNTVPEIKLPNVLNQNGNENNQHGNIKYDDTR